jgi:hypothetical protein
MMRKLHRWISTTAMMLLTWVACTGVLLAIDSMYPPAGLSDAVSVAQVAASVATAANTGAVAAPLDPAAVDQWLTNALQTAISSGTKPESIDVQLSMQDGQPIAQVAITGDDARTTIVNTATGTVIKTSTPSDNRVQVAWYDDAATRVRLHDLLQDLHRGTIIGFSGQLLDILTGMSFAFLTISGAVMYFQLYLRRRQNGKQQLFWT